MVASWFLVDAPAFFLGALERRPKTIPKQSQKTEWFQNSKTCSRSAETDSKMASKTEKHIEDWSKTWTRNRGFPPALLDVSGFIQGYLQCVWSGTKLRFGLEAIKEGVLIVVRCQRFSSSNLSKRQHGAQVKTSTCFLMWVCAWWVSSAVSRCDKSRLFCKFISWYWARGPGISIHF